MRVQIDMGVDCVAHTCDSSAAPPQGE
jgi:hypothetical protein